MSFLALHLPSLGHIEVCYIKSARNYFSSKMFPAEKLYKFVTFCLQTKTNFVLESKWLDYTVCSQSIAFSAFVVVIMQLDDVSD